MLYSQGIALEDLGIGQKTLDEEQVRCIWIRFAESYYLFRGTPTRMWLDHAFQEQFGLNDRLAARMPAPTMTSSAPSRLLQPSGRGRFTLSSTLKCWLRRTPPLTR